MTPAEFFERHLQERHRFLRLCREENVWARAETATETAARAFAQGLILDLTEAQARARMRLDPTGAASVAAVVAALVRDRKTRPLLAERLPSEELTPFYLLSALVLDATGDAPPPGHRADS